MIQSNFTFLKLIAASVCISIQLSAQNSNKVQEFNEQEFRKMALVDGVPAYKINKLVAEKKLFFQKLKDTPSIQTEKKGGDIVPFASCSDMGGENGWMNWKGRAGTIAMNGAVTWGPWSNPPPASNANTAFTLTSGTANDGCTPSPGSPALPVVAPGFGNFSIMLGVPVTPKAFCEQISFPLTVTASDTNFLYAYAIVLDNPADGNHVGIKAPHAEIYMLDAKGDTVPCSHQLYFGSNDNVLPPGFFQTNCNDGYANAYKPWATVGVNLSKYLNTTVNVVVSNYDCSLGGHFCHSYWDFACPPIAGNDPPFCLGNSTTLVGPPSDVSNPYTYKWYVNGLPYGNPIATTVSITPTPKSGDIYAVHVHQPSGCDFWVPYKPQPMSVTPDFTYAGSCGTLDFKGSATTNPTGTAITSWNWNFGGGSPNTSTAQNPSGIFYSPGSYTVTLIVTSQNGCTDTIKLPVVSTGLPQGTFTVPPVCLNSTSIFTGTSQDAITQWDWDFGDGSTGTGATPTHTYTSCGTFTSTLIITSVNASCTDTIIKQVKVNCLPVSVPTVKNTCFNNANQFTDLSVGNNSISNWLWDFGDGNTSTSQNPKYTYGAVGTYTVSLIVTNDGGCKDTNKTTVVISPLPVPNFSSIPVCAGNPTCFKDGSVVTPGTVIGWSWNFGDQGSGAANTSSLQNPCHTYNGQGPYNVILTVTSDSGCQNVITLPANLNPRPTAGITPKNVCFKSSATFTDASISPAGAGNTINAWDWNFGDGSPNSTQQNPAHLYAAPGTYTITLIVTTQNGCKDTTTNTVTIYNPPVANFEKPINGCSPVYANYKDLSTSADGTVNNWQWSFPGGSPLTSTDQSPTNIEYKTVGTYSVSLIVTTTNGCIDSIQLPMVEVYPWPSADFCVAPKTAPTTDPKFNFCDMWSKDVTQWAWDFGDGTTDSLNTDPVHSYSATANNNDFYKYNICIRVQNQHGCWAAICHDIELIPEFEFYIPNTFTPNGDGNNELFYGKCRGVKEYNIWLFDRWGNQVWDCHHDDKNTNWDSDATSPKQEGLSSYCKWDGVVVQGGMDMNGNSRQFAQEDVYVWKVQLTDIFNKKHSYIGHVNIVR